MKKYILFGILIIIAVIIFIGYYPPFFPFLKYGLLSQPATKVVFDIENFSTLPENFSLFLQEIEDTVHKYWYEDARLAIIFAVFIPETDKKVVAYGLQFFSDSHPGVSEGLPSQLTVYYSGNLVIRKEFIDKFFNFKYHEGEVANNKKLIATECIDPFVCQFLVQNITGRIEPTEIKISGKQAFEIALTKKPELAEKDYLYDGEPGWFGMLIVSEDMPIWKILPTIKIDARTGEILE